MLLEDFMELSDDGKTLIRCYTNHYSVEIPSSVEVIKEGAFAFSYALKSLIIPDHVKRLENILFSASGLISIYIGKGIEFIDDATFLGAEQLVYIEVDPLNQHYASINGVLYDKKIETLVCFPYQIEMYNYEYVLPKTLKSIGLYAIGVNDSIETLILNEHLAPIDWNVFAGFYKLKKITAKPKNDHFYIDDHFLLSTDKTVLIAYYNNDNTPIIIPSTVKKIVSKAFTFEQEIEKIYLNKDLELIQEWGVQLYEHETETLEVYYEGTKEEFQQKVTVLQNEEFLNANWHYKK